LFPLGIEPGIPRARPWKELLATGAQATWFNVFKIENDANLYRKYKSVVNYVDLFRV
jgi:fibrillarin-like rRNA methylase